MLDNLSIFALVNNAVASFAPGPEASGSGCALVASTLGICSSAMTGAKSGSKEATNCRAEATCKL